MSAVIERLLPPTIDRDLGAPRAALWLLWLYAGLKLVMSVNSIINPAAVAGGADGIPIDRYGPEAAAQVLLLFALVAAGQLALTLAAIVALLRYRALVPLVYLLLLFEHFLRRAIIYGWTGSWSGSGPALVINLALTLILLGGLALSLMRKRPAQ